MLLHLPDELLLAVTAHVSPAFPSFSSAMSNIFRQIPHEDTLQALACTCTRLYSVALPEYYRKLGRTRRCDPLVAAAVHGNLRAVETLLEQGCSARTFKAYQAKKVRLSASWLFFFSSLRHGLRVVLMVCV
jgi:hypothetical protein